MKKIELIKPKTLPNENEFLWRYIDIHKLLNFLNSHRIIFTRMDQFEDPLEGVPYEIHQRIFHLNNEEDFNLADLILRSNPNPLILRGEIFGRIDKIVEIQSSHYISCWFYEQRESMAMWNLYSNPEGVALKIPFDKLVQNLLPDETESNIKNYFCGKVEYQDFRDGTPLSKLRKVSLRKDVSFAHEKEIRFVIKNSSAKTNAEIIMKSAPLKLENLGLKVVCHPKMSGWKKENIKNILKEKGLLKSYSESEIKLRVLGN